MIAIRRILCPVDFSRFSRHALEQAVSLARETGAEVSVLHVYVFAPVALPVSAGGSIPLEPMRLDVPARAAMQAELREFVNDIDTEGITLTTTLFEGDAVGRILDRATDWNADLLVMGTHGRTGFERLLLGSVTEKILRKSTCPVLTVPPRVMNPVGGLSFAKILCAMDFSPASFRAIEYAATLAAPGGPGVTALNVVEFLAEATSGRHELVLDTPAFHAELKRAALERLHEAIPPRVRERCPVLEMVTMGKAWKEILRVAKTEEAELIVLGVEGRSRPDLLFFGSTTQHVLRQAECPVLTIRA